MIKTGKYILLLFFALNYFHISAQNGWTKEKNEFCIQLSASAFSSKAYYNHEGKLFNNGATYNAYAVRLFGEYGLSKQFSALINAPLLKLNNFSTTETVGGLGDIRLGVKYNVFKNLPLAIQVDVEIPTDYGNKFARSDIKNSLGMYDYINLPTSDGEFNFWTTIAYSQSSKSGKTYGSIYCRLNFRTEFKNQLQTGLEVGHKFFNVFYVIGKYKIQERLSTENSTVGTFLYGEGTTYSVYDITGLIDLSKHFSIILSVSDYIDTFGIKKRNLYDGYTFTIGAAVK